VLTQQELKAMFSYNPETGLFTNLGNRGTRAKAGDIAGTIYPNGYRYIQIKNRAYRTNRLAWLYVFGEWPKLYVEHKNTVKSDDRISNLRLATNSENQANRGNPINNISGTKGIRFETDRMKWRAQIVVNGKSRNLGRFKTREEAMAAYANAAEKAWGDFAKVG